MKKIDFEKLLFTDKINYFNDKLREGQTVIRIREDLGISEKGWQKEVKQNGFKYDTKSKIYINIRATTKNTTLSTTNKEIDLLHNSQLELSNYLIDNFSILKDMLEKYKSTTKGTTTSTTNKIIINLVNDKQLNPKPKSIRINEFVYQDWQKFCEENKLYSKQELISMALKEYMEKYI
mgnify:CR=1 FL=1